MAKSVHLFTVWLLAISLLLHPVLACGNHRTSQAASATSSSSSSSGSSHTQPSARTTSQPAHSSSSSSSSSSGQKLSAYVVDWVSKLTIFFVCRVPLTSSFTGPSQINCMGQGRSYPLRLCRTYQGRRAFRIHCLAAQIR